jgi:hypothetical protein
MITDADLHRASALVLQVGDEFAHYVNGSGYAAHELVRLVPRLVAEVEKLRSAVLRPLDTSDVIAALHEGHAERKVAEHDNAWTSLMRQRDEARAEVERMRPVYEAAIAIDVGASHPDYGIVSQRLAVARTGHERKGTS